ncbi:MAG: hypothetical protein JJ920_19700 [Roseitalea sp.]|jgi:LPS O-antigen subunit length determinant protein (WzzB/FepE family)|nr:hypothetical protein [Roseitalea sp.]MBO6722784.1 hypothetical protein [Roseitalea sp.]MBO6745142.1 hypothetical protein [Roseitalea sp.]
MGKADNMEQTIVAQQAEGELRLSDIVVGLWDGRWIIAGAIAVGLAAGFAVSWALAESSSAELVIVPSTDASDQSYLVLNQRLDFAPLRLDVGDGLTLPGTGRGLAADLSADDIEVTSDMLMEEFFRQLRSLPVVAASLDEAGVLSQSQFRNRQTLQSTAARFAVGIDFRAPAEQDRASTFRQRYWTMTYSGTADDAAMRAFAAAAIERATANVRNLVLDRVTAVINRRAEDEVFALDDLNAIRQIAVDDYQAELNAQMAQLSEQAAIARRLEIEASQVDQSSRFEAEAMADGGGSLLSITREAPAYLRGYAALEEEIRLLEQRSGPEFFLDVLPEIALQTGIIRADQQVERARAALQESPLVDDDFHLVEFDPGLVAVEGRYPLPTSLAIGLLLGTVAGMLLVAGRNLLRGRRI